MALAVPVPKLVGARVKRKEDPKLLTGQATYVDDLDLPGTLHMAVLRSPHGHARIRGIDATRALALPGVRAVLTGAEVARLAQPLPVVWRRPGMKQTGIPLLATDKARFVGEGVAVVLAADRYAAEDALELIEVDYEPLPAVVDAEAALEPGAPLLHEEWGDNIVCAMERDAGDVAAALAAAEVVIEETFRIQRYTALALEGRGVVAAYEPATDMLTLWTSTQVPHHVRSVLAEAMDFPEHHLRVIAPQVGGGFGSKDHAYPEEVIACLLARQTRQPVKWIEDRRENFLSSVHAREQIHQVRVAARRDGTITGLTDRLLADVGAYTANVGIGPAVISSGMLTGPYRIANLHADVYGVVTNKVPFGSYRGFGMTQSTFVIERIIDTVARRLNLDPAEVRLRNLVGPAEMPYESPTLQTYDSGDYPESLRQAMELAGYADFRAEQAARRERGEEVGIGICTYVEFTGLGPSPVMAIIGFNLGGYETAVCRMDPMGKVTVAVGVTSHGQSLETTLAQIAADQLGVPLEDVEIVQGDTALCPYSGLGTVASRSATLAGAATLVASGRVREKLLAIAGYMLEASPEDLELANGTIAVRGTPARFVSVRQVATAAHLAHDLPEGMPGGLEERYLFDPSNVTFSYATHIAKVAVDSGTGRVTVEDYAVVHDCGTMLNPTVVEGQVAGGVAQGLGGALLEELRYDESGQLLTASFMDYLMPTAVEVPGMAMGHMEVPAPHIPGGMKGMGEGGAIAAPAAIANAVEDALAHRGVRVTETPLTPERVWRLIQDAPGVD